MRINFTKLIQESGERLTKVRLAREMSEAGLFKSIRSAETTIQDIEHGRAKGIKWDLIKFLAARFHRPGSEIIEWNE